MLTIDIVILYLIALFILLPTDCSHDPRLASIVHYLLVNTAHILQHIPQLPINYSEWVIDSLHSLLSHDDIEILGESTPIAECIVPDLASDDRRESLDPQLPDSFGPLECVPVGEYLLLPYVLHVVHPLLLHLLLHLLLLYHPLLLTHLLHILLPVVLHQLLMQPLLLLSLRRQVVWSE
jgi:hypothetical protein